MTELSGDSLTMANQSTASFHLGSKSSKVVPVKERSRELLEMKPDTTVIQVDSSRDLVSKADGPKTPEGSTDSREAKKPKKAKKQSSQALLAAPPQPQPQVQVQVLPSKLFKTPKETAQYMLVAAKAKKELPWDKLIILSFMSGIFVCFGATLAIVVAKGSPTLPAGISKFVFGSCFHVALVFIVLFGGELFTGNAMTMTLALVNGNITWKDYARSLLVTYFINFAGCVFGAAFFVYYAQLFAAEPFLSATKDIAVLKNSLPYHVVFLRAIAANWLVCIGVFMAASAETIEGKILSCYLPVMTFAASSYEHCIANMYFIPLGLMNGAETTFGEFIYRNLILATLGNYLGGALFMGLVIWWVYVRAPKEPVGELKV